MSNPVPDELPVVPQKAMRRFRWRQVGIGAAVFVLLMVAVAPFRNLVAGATSRVILFVASPFAPSIAGFDDLPQASRVLAADGTEIGLIGTEQRELVELKDLPPHVTRAVLAAEDANFYSHSGVDPTAVFRAVLRSASGPSQGGSTITQQLAKLNYTGAHHSFGRKFKELLYASRLEKAYSKDQLLERYLNQVYFGDGAYGIAAAADTFFGVPPQELTPAQAAMLAAKIRAPSQLDPYTNAERLQKRRDQVLEGMVKRGWINRQELDGAVSTAISVKPRDPNAGANASGKAPHFLAYVGREANKLGELGESEDLRARQLLTGGYTVESTLDLKAYDAAAAAARDVLGEPGDPTTAVVSVQPGDGSIRVLFGGLDPNLQFDIASQGRRQPGSSFKPHVYLAALRAGVDPRSTVDTGSPKTFDCRGTPWTVRNYEGMGGGMATIDDAMADSVNVVFAELMTRVGPNAVASVAETAGVSKTAVNPPECAMALGGLRQGVTPLEQASSFATFAARGKYAEPYAIKRIKDRNGQVVYDKGTPRTAQAFTATEVGVLTASLERVVQGGTGTAAAIGRPLAGKTGTTENYGNAWFIGYVPQMSTAVWVGRTEGDLPMRDVRGISVTGGSFPARIFSRYMRTALADVPVQDLFRASPDELPSRSPATTAVPPPPPPPPPAPPATAAPAPVQAPLQPQAPVTTRPQVNVIASPTTTRPPQPPPTAAPAPPTTARPATTVPNTTSSSRPGNRT